MEEVEVEVLRVLRVLSAVRVERGRERERETQRDTGICKEAVLNID